MPLSTEEINSISEKVQEILDKVGPYKYKDSPASDGVERK